MIHNIGDLSIFFFETDKNFILITSIFLYMIILSLFLLILPDFLPKMLILIIEIVCTLLIIQISKDISNSINFFLDILQNFKGISENSLIYLDLIIKFEIQITFFKTLSLMLFVINFSFTILELL